MENDRLRVLQAAVQRVPPEYREGLLAALDHGTRPMRAREIERALRDAGRSKSQATALASSLTRVAVLIVAPRLSLAKEPDLMSQNGDYVRALAELLLTKFREMDDPSGANGKAFADAAMIAAANYMAEVHGAVAAVDQLRDRADFLEAGMLRAVKRGHDFGKEG